MGLLIMLIVSVLVFFILKGLLGLIWALLLSIFVFVGWMLVNIKAVKSGIIKANLGAYFKARRNNIDHEEALMYMIQSRYKYQPAMYDEVVSSVEVETNEQQSIRNVIMKMHEVESGRLPPYEWILDFSKRFDRLYASMKRNG